MKKLIVAGGLLALCLAVVACHSFASQKTIKMTLPKGARIIDVGAEASIKTLNEALAHVAEIRKTDITTPLALRVASGDYWMAPGQSLSITKAHAATNFAPLVIYAADFANKPHIHGGTLLKDWKKVSFNNRDDVWMADATILSNTPPMTILFNGKKMDVARWPKTVAGNPYRGGFTFVGDPDAPTIEEAKKVKVYGDELWRRAEDVRAWAHPEDGTAVIFPLHYYGTCGYKIESVSNRVLRLKQKHYELTGLHRYDMWHVVNIAEELTLPGEWYLNPREQKIYLITPDGSDPNKAIITSTKRGQSVISLTKIANCTLAGLELSGGGDGIYFHGPSQFVEILGCSIHDHGGNNHGGGGSGLNMHGLDLRVADCDIFNCGNYGIWHNSAGSAKVDGRQRNVIENNYFHHIGRVGIWNFGQGIKVANNLFHDIDGSAFSGYGRFLDICYNRIRHVCITAQDTGALYDSGWGNGTGTQIRYNHISDVIGKNRNDYYLGACGIYFDECTGGAFVYGNLIEHAHWASFHLHCARYVTITNNVFVSNGNFPSGPHSCQFSYGNWGPYRKGFCNRDLHVGEYNFMVRVDENWKKFPAFSQDANTNEIYCAEGFMMMGNRFENNIVYYPDQGGSGKMVNGNLLNLSTNSFNKNVYWAGRQKDGTVREVFMNRHDKEGMTLANWQQKGGDKDSIVADPLFANPTNGNYRLKPESPAYKFGFVDLPYDQMGLKKTKFRPELPQEAEGLREHPEWLDVPPPVGRTFKVKGPQDYLAIDLSAGASAQKYPVAKISPDAVKTIGDEFKTDKLLLAKIPAGEYDMQGNRPVKLTKDFYMGVFEVTQKQYENVTGQKPSFYKGEKRPVESVSYLDVTNFCATLSLKTGLNIALPTEAQWEYACRAGTASLYNNGTEKFDGLGRCYDNQTDGAGGFAQHTTVGSYAPNAWGLYDMHGNVWEVCYDMMDWFLGVDPVVDPTGLRQREGGYNVIRGGGWADFTPCCTSRMRFYNWPDHRYNMFGFRIISTSEK